MRLVEPDAAARDAAARDDTARYAATCDAAAREAATRDNGDQRPWWPPSGLDVGLAVGLAAAIAVAVAARIEQNATREPDAGAYLIAVALGAVLLVRRRWPVGVALTTIGLLGVYYSVGYPAVGFAVPVSVAFYSVAEAGRLRTAIWLSASTFTLTMSYRLFIEADEDRSVLVGYDMVATAAMLLAVLALGEAVRTRRALHAQIADRARYAALEREHEAVRQVQAERLRIARDIHDVLAHTVAVISIQSAVAGEALDDLDPDTARASVATIRAASAEALGELRTTVSLLRSGGEPDGLAPAPGLAETGRLVENAAKVGLVVTVREVGSVRPVPPVVDLTAHRILQESITNVIRHAEATTASVVLRYSPGTLVVEVTDDGRGNPSNHDRDRERRDPDADECACVGANACGCAGAGIHVGANAGANAGTNAGTNAGADVGAGGFGIRGMRERAAAVGGWLEAGPGPAGGFRVTARLPTQRR